MGNLKNCFCSKVVVLDPMELRNKIFSLQRVVARAKALNKNFVLSKMVWPKWIMGEFDEVVNQLKINK